MRKISGRVWCLFAILCFIGNLSFPIHGTDTAFAKSTDQKIAQEKIKSDQEKTKGALASDDETQLLEDIPDYSGEPYVMINDNIPDFLEEDLTTKSYESYSELDDKERCGAAIACIGKDLMPTEERGPIGNVKPSGWHTVKYNDRIDGNYLYNRCHLIGYQLSGENANEKNLITGTRYLNTEGMLPFENMVADYVEETDNHVLYRVTPVFEGDNLVASGVIMEAQSVEDEGKSILFHVFCYNVQPGVIIDYETGESETDENYSPEEASVSVSEKTENTENTKNTENIENPAAALDYVVNTNTKKFHYPSCSSAKSIKSSNRLDYSGMREELIGQGYDPCKRCKP